MILTDKQAIEIYEGARICEGAIIHEGARINWNSNGVDFFTVGQCGDNYRTVTIKKDLSIINCGCFNGNHESFRVEVLKKYGSDFGSYGTLITILDSYSKSLTK